MTTPARTTGQGVNFAATTSEVNAEEQRPTTPTVKGVIVDAARAVDTRLAERIDTATNWRDSYLAAVRDLTAASAVNSDAAVDIARAGLDSARSRMVFDNGTDEVPLSEWDVESAVRESRATLGTREVHGEHEPVTTLAVPYGGRELTGHDLERQLDAWVTRGIIEASCADAVKHVINHPEWLSLPGHVMATVGAGAEMGPLELLCRWGAKVLAVDVPQATGRLEKFAKAGAGTVALPVTPDGKTGTSIVADPAAVAAWIEEHAGDDTIVFGMHAYADSGMHVRLTLAGDAISRYLQQARPTTVLAYLATPTDAFVVPAPVVEGARSRWQRQHKRSVVQRGMNLATRGQLFSEPYPKGSSVADCLVAQQGPNYAVAKRLQRWSAVAAEANGNRVSFNVAPATLTRSVTKNTVLRAVYGGAHHFGVEVFAPETSRALMAALLVYDVMRDDVAPGAAVPRNHPEELFSDSAAHGGLWRTAWAPRSALGVAGVLGAPKLLRRRG